MKRRTLISTALLSTLAMPAFAATTANMPMRKTENRMMSEKECWDLINEVEYAVVSTADADGIPYGVPVSTAVTPDKRSFSTVYWSDTGASTKTSRPIPMSA